MNSCIARVFLLLIGLTAVHAAGHFARPRSLRALNTGYVPRWHQGLWERFKQRAGHQLIPLSHDIPIVRPRSRVEYHDGEGDKKNLRLAGPSGVTFEVCFQNDNGFPCLCPQIKDTNDYEIDCRNESLRTTNIVPTLDSKDQRITINVVKVNLEGNVITELWEDQIVPGHESTLKELILQRNSIYYIGEKAFSKMNSLVTLDLSFNRLTHLPRKAFGGGEGLEWKLENLYLDNNQLTKIDDGAFKDLTMLKKIDLDDNVGLTLTNNTFGALHNLEELSLEGCGLYNLSQSVFAMLTQLKYLSLRGNPLSIVPAPVRAIKSLIVLDISATFITEFTHDALDGDYKLETLRARDMPYLWAIENCAFCGLPHLQSVNFFNCSHLYYIDPEAFGNETTRANTPRNITLLDFEKGNISSLPSNLLNWSQVPTLKLGGNPYHCDCKLSWMTDPDVDYSAGDHTPSCASPPHLLGRPLNVLRKRELCNGSFRFGRLFIGLSLLLLASVGLLVGWYICTTRGRDGNGFRLRNVFYKPQLPRYGYRNLMVKEDEQVLANDDYNERQNDYNRKDKMLPPAVEV